MHGHAGKPLERSLFTLYFEKLYHACNLDVHGIDSLLKVDSATLGVNFRSAAEKFKLIQNEDSASIIVRYCGPDGDDESIEKWLNKLKKEGPDRWLMRKLQRYMITIPRRDAMRLLAQGDIEELFPCIFIQTNDLLYHDLLGLTIDGLLFPASAFVV